MPTPETTSFKRKRFWIYGAGAIALLIVLFFILRSPRGETLSPTIAAEPPATHTLEEQVVPTELSPKTAVPAGGETGSGSSPEPEPAVRPPDPATDTPDPTPLPIIIPERIVFQSNRDGDFEIYIMEIDGSNQIPLTRNSFEDQYPVVSPDGRQIVYQSNRDGNFEIYVMNVDGSDQHRLTFSNSNDRLPTWSPNSRRIAFISDRDGDYDVYVIDSDGSDLYPVTNNELRMGHISWSVDDLLVFNGGTTDGRTWEIYTVNLDGQDSRQLTENNISDWAPEWSPDGSQILFLSIRGNDDPAIYLMNADGGNRRLLFNSPDYEWGADWSTDGKTIVFTRERGDFDFIYKMNHDGTGVKLISERSSYPSWIPGRTVSPSDIPDPDLESGAMVSATGVPSCELQIGDIAQAAANARLWPAPDVVNNRAEHEISLGAQLVIRAGPEWARVQRDADVSGWWWRVESVLTGESGWIWQNRLVECENLPEQ